MTTASGLEPEIEDALVTLAKEEIPNAIRFLLDVFEGKTSQSTLDALRAQETAVDAAADAAEEAKLAGS